MVWSAEEEGQLPVNSKMWQTGGEKQAVGESIDNVTEDHQRPLVL